MGLTNPPSPSTLLQELIHHICSLLPNFYGFRGRSFLSFQLLPKGKQQILVPNLSRASPFLPGSCDSLEPEQPENRCQRQHYYLTCSHCSSGSCRGTVDTLRDSMSLALSKGLPRDCCHISEESSFYPWRWG